jgi:MFS family permease
VAESSVETRTSWVVASASLAVMSVSYGAPLVAVIALKPIAAELGSARSIPALAYSLAWLGTAVGGTAMGPIAERVGVRWTVVFGALMIAAGLWLSSLGGTWPLLVGHGVLIGLIGNAGLNAPLYVYVTHWFDKRRGTALALISSGQYVAGALWPAIFERGIAELGWRATMHLFSLVELALVIPLALLFLRRPPHVSRAPAPAAGRAGAARVMGLPPNVAFLLVCGASFLCCVPMAMPAGHLVALCSDLGIAPSHGAAMLSLLLACAFISRQFWGWVADRIGGLRTVLIGSGAMALTLSGFLLTQDELGLFAVSASFGLAFSGIIPAYVLATRELFSAREAPWRVPIQLLFSGSGMALGGWLAGLLYDHFGAYAPAFLAGLGFNLANFVAIGFLVLQRYGGRAPALPLAASSPVKVDRR